MTNDKLRMTPVRVSKTRRVERVADMVAAGSHRLSQSWYKDYRNSWLQRLANLLRLLLNPINLLIIAIPLQNAGTPDDYRLWVGLQGPTRKISRTREKRWSKMITSFKYNGCRFARLENRVRVASERVPVASKRVRVASERVPVRTQQVIMSSKLARGAIKDPGLDNHQARAYPVIGT
jgi:hypothetical protein